MKKLLFIKRVKLNFDESDSTKISYQDIVEGEKLRLRAENTGLDITNADEHITITDEYIIIPFWAEYK